MKREDQLSAIQETAIWDIVIIGGGATGLGAAVDAASRGLKTLLLEQYDFAKGTSSRSTKLLHGGVRYLAQGNIKLVKSALKERGILLKNAPHISHPLTFIIPAIRWYDKYFYGIGLKIYDWLAGTLALGKTKFIAANKMHDFLPTLTKKNISGGVLYEDGQFDDARFAISLALTAVAQKASLLNYACMQELIKENNICTGVVFTDTLHNKKYTVNTKVVINATGVFADKVLQMDQPELKPVLSPSQGVHLVVDKKYFTGTNALMIPKTKDGRVLFALPWHDKVVIGTTDTEIKEISIEPKALETEVDFIIEHFNLYNNIAITKNDILSVFAGLRPLIKKNSQKTASLSRDHHIWISNTQMITITGGKWTTYRKMGEEVIDKTFAFLEKPFIKSDTQNLRLADYTTDQNIPENLRQYGNHAKEIEALMQQDASLKEKLHPGFNYSRAELVWAMKNEMACTVEDILARRSRILFLNARSAIEIAPKTATLMAKYLKKEAQWVQGQIDAFTSLAKNYLINDN